MTRDEAINHARQLCASSWSEREMADIIDLLAALGLLKLDTVEDEIRQAAARKIAGSMICIRSGPNNVAGYLDRNTSFELIDILTKSGFKITR